MKITAFDLASRFIGVKETPGIVNNPMILAMLQLDQKWPLNDEVPWCSAFVNYIAWLLRLPRTKNLAARSWLGVGRPVALWSEARPDFDVVILSRGPNPQPGPNVIDAPGHVGFFAGTSEGGVLLLAGNQGNQVSIQLFPHGRVLGVRRLWED